MGVDIEGGGDVAMVGGWNRRWQVGINFVFGWCISVESLKVWLVAGKAGWFGRSGLCGGRQS